MLNLKKIGGSVAGKGHYWNFSTGEKTYLKNPGKLPGTEKDSFYRVSPLVLLLASPLIGLIYAMFLPFAGMAMLIREISKKLVHLTASQVKKIAVFTWTPGMAYLAGNNKEEKAKKRNDEKNRE